MLDFKKLSKALIPLSLMTMTTAFADSEIADNCCPTPCCPKPCCVPQPKPCIDCECYNPAYYDLQCDWGVFVSVDFLYWYARETNLDFAYSQQGFTEQTQAAGACTRNYFFPTKHHYVGTAWKPGFRVGIGMNSSCDGWDLLLDYTYFRTHKTNNVTDPNFFARGADLTTFCQNGIVAIVDPWATEINSTDPLAQHFPRIDAKWSLNFNQIDLELGRKYWVSKCMTVRPYIGVRGAWTKTNFNVVTGPVTDPNVFVSIQDNFRVVQGPDSSDNSRFFRNKFWGVGLLGGLQPEFMLGNWCGCGNFSIYGNVDGALLWGKYRGRNRLAFLAITTQSQQDLGPPLGPVLSTVINRSANPVETDDYSRMQGILDLGLGLRWEEHWCCDRYSTSIDLGWEHHYWFDFGMYHRIIGRANEDQRGNLGATPLAIISEETGNSNMITDLGFGGLVIRFRFDF